MKRAITFLLFTLFVMSMSAYDFKSGNFYYNITSSNTVEVTYQEDWSSDNYLGLTFATIPETVTYNDITYSVTSIGSHAFIYCWSLNSITIGNGVTSIGDNAFYGCSSLTSITIGNSVTSIGDFAFGSCDALYSVYIEATTPPTLDGSFEFDNTPSPICYIPCGTKAAYEASDWASQVRKFVELCEEKYTTLTYTSTDGNIVTPEETEVFGANIVSNEYKDGQGVITFDCPVTSIGDDAFSGCSSLASITIPNSVTVIGDAAFNDCSSLTSIAIPNSVTSIHTFAFARCSSLVEIEIPKSVISIGDSDDGRWACQGIFMGCNNLQKIVVEEGNPIFDSRDNCNAIIETATNTLIAGCPNTEIPNGIKRIGAGAFRECNALGDIDIPSSVNVIEEAAFYGTGITKVVIPLDAIVENSTWSSGRNVLFGAFAGCEQLTDIVIPEGTTRIASGMLAGCSSLESLTIPASVTSIGKWAFYNCDALTSITIPDGVMSIENGAFYGCSLLTSITIPSDVTSIGRQAFEECSSLNTITCEATTPPMLEYLKGSPVFTSSPICYIPCGTKSAYEASDWAQYVSEFVEEDCVDPTWQILYTSTDGNIVTPNKTDVFGANIVSNEYKDGQGVITFDGPVTSIGDYAFWSCSSLTSIAIPNSVTTIGDHAFYNCSLTSLTIPNSVTSIGVPAFEYCSSLTSIVVEDGNTHYDSRENCNAIIEKGSNDLIFGCQNTIIPNSVRLIRNGAFSGCSSLTSITIPNSVTGIEEDAFWGCSSLTSITIGNSVASIGETVFGYCTNLTFIVVEDGNATYDSRNNCNAIIETESNTLIAGCKNTTIPNGIESIGDNAFAYCTLLSSITIPNSVTSIGDDAFSVCNSLTSIVIPNSVTSIGDLAFSSCYSLTSVTIGNGVESIGERAFVSCDSLKTVICEAIELPELEWGIFLGVPLAEATLYVPAQSLDDYKAATQWKDFGTILPIEEEEPEEKYIITYTSTDDNIVTPYKTDVFGANIVSNTYQDGQGVITFDGPVTSIGNNAFYECSSLTSITIPSSVTSIGDLAFSDCSSITFIAIPNSVTSIGQLAFSDCSSLASITIPNSVTSIGHGFSNGCDQVTSMVVETGNAYYDSRESCNAIIKTATNTLIAGCQSTVIPNSVTSIGNDAFKFYTSLTSIIIPNSIMSIGLDAFMGCSSLASLTIPNSVTSIGGWAFWYCTSLNTIYVEATTPPTLSSSAFGNTSSPICYIPCGTKAAYEASDWAQYVSEFVEGCDNGSYSRNVRIGYNTICLPHGSSNFTGATFYEIAHILKNKKKIFFDEVKTLEAGKPYIFYPHSNEVTIYYDNTTSAIPLSHNGLHGTFDGITAASNFLKGKYLVVGDRMVLCGDGCSLAANRAYIELDEISDKDHPAIPGIKRVSMDYSEENATTALDNITDETIVAPMQEGVYDILGRKVDAPTVSGFYIINGKKVFVK